MDIRIFETREDVAAAAARRVVEAIHARPNLVLGVPAGQTPVPVYEELRRLHRTAGVDFSGITCFTIDEFLGLERTHPSSFRRFLEEHLFSGINVDPRRVHSLNGAADDVEGECQNYERMIDAAGGIELQILGLGRNGHIGFNEPADVLVARTHRVTLHADTRRDNAARFGGNPDRVPLEALSMGIGTILAARQLLLIATGEAKAGPVEQSVRGGVTTRVPASMLQLHSDVELYLDRPAASRLHT